MISCFSSNNKALTMDILTYETEKLKKCLFFVAYGKILSLTARKEIKWSKALV